MWTEEQEANARVWANERGAKSRALAGALDEIGRLRACNNHQKLLNLVDRFIDLVSVEDDADHKPEECDSCELVDDARHLVADLKGN